MATPREISEDASLAHQPGYGERRAIPLVLTTLGERVVMARTSLPLLEGDRLASKEDRQLILQAAFSPTSDGIVEDEGIPPSALEFLTRPSRG